MLRVLTLLALVCAVLLPNVVGLANVYAQRGAQQYQQQRRPDYDHKHRYPRFRQPSQSYYQNGWYQRPYPFHLDYYRMQYGGSYDPYFGNIYGPPRIYNFGPMAPFFGGFGGAYYW